MSYENDRVVDCTKGTENSEKINWSLVVWVLTFSVPAAMMIALATTP